jgi:hypothetical protein
VVIVWDGSEAADKRIARAVERPGTGVVRQGMRAIGSDRVCERAGAEVADGVAGGNAVAWPERSSVWGCFTLLHPRCAMRNAIKPIPRRNAARRDT